MIHDAIQFWGNMDRVRSIHSFFEVIGLVFFVLMVVFEVLAHKDTKNKKRTHFWDLLAIISVAVAIFCEVAAYPLGKQSEKLSDAEIEKLRPRPIKERIMAFLNSRQPQLLSNLSNGVTRFEWFASIPDVGVLQEFLRDPEGPKYMELYVLDLQFMTTQTGTMIQGHKLDLRLKPELIK